MVACPPTDNFCDTSLAKAIRNERLLHFPTVGCCALSHQSVLFVAGSSRAPYADRERLLREAGCVAIVSVQQRESPDVGKPKDDTG